MFPCWSVLFLTQPTGVPSGFGLVRRLEVQAREWIFLSLLD